ncbi:ferritin [Desulfurivibrio alkaliphilus]|uniref:Ferritin n=1 Tax=Desulfurivibrio alkaliphilus (strain DSM 19089 / UNIQEM U267 / AHT2) TaxID=589865 RepID=D6Z6K7_DESAT|nr:ferritin [Desulfurivibrio alkaliphilus]ADH84966.1 Ferroxidase [Desulfurivibrio alkaliphilus AHT 2]
MLSQKMETALNQQVNAELYSSYLYLSMSAFFSGLNLGGSAHWMRLQAQEELNHALKIYDFVNERGGRVELSGIEAPLHQWDSPTAVFEEVLRHEQKVTGLINDLVDLAIAEKDHATNNFLQWFVAEQVEEEASANEVLQKMQLAVREGGLFILDQELAKRVPPPTAQ